VLEHVIEVRFDRIYGRLTCYPVNDAAKALAEIAGTKTLTPAAIEGARKLGFKVAIAPESVETLENFVGGTA
jgi:hypothetical protein